MKRPHIKIETFNYIPFVGWILPMTLFKNDSKIMHHAKQGFLLAFLTVITLLFLTFITIFIPKTSRLGHLILTIIIYLIELTYFIFCIVGTMWVIQQKEKNFPLISKHLSKINI